MRPLQKITPILLGILISLFTACSEVQVTDKTDRSPGTSPQARARHWADSLTATLSTEQLIPHLCIIPAPDQSDSTGQAQADTLLKSGFAGLLLPLTHVDTYALRLPALPATPWLVADLDTHWTAHYNFPNLMQLGATHDETLSADWGSTLGRVLRHMGANMALISAARLAGNAEADLDALGGHPAHVFRMATPLLEALQQTGIQPVLRALPAGMRGPFGVPVSYHDKQRFLEHDLIAYRGLTAQADLPIQTAWIRYPALDSQIAPFSPKINTLLRDTQHGLIFSPTLDSLHTAEGLDIGEVALRCWEAGADIIVCRRGHHSLLSSLQAALKKGRITEATLRTKVANVLTHKALQAPPPPAPPLTIPGSHSILALDRLITQSALVLLRDDKRRLPLRGDLSNLNIHLLSLETPPPAPFRKSLGPYAATATSILPSDTTTKTRLALQDLSKKASIILLPLTPESQYIDAEGRVDSIALRLIQQLDSSKKLVLINFGPIASLRSLQGLHCVIQAWDARPQTQEAAAQFIFGALPSQGKLPVECTEAICFGDGLPRPDRLRLAYTIPEAIGADPRILHLIDSIVGYAIRAHAFPGCQILAAKQGKVFFHKAYGHHDYTRQRPVLLDDLYDIASVTKIAATTLMAMHAWEQDTLHLEAPLKHYLPELDSSFITVRNLTPQLLLLHQAGLPAGLPIYKYCVANDSVDSVRVKYYSRTQDSTHTVQVTENLWFNPTYLDSLRLRVRRTPLDTIGNYRYSDMSMYWMQQVLERIYETPLNTFVETHFYRPMGLRHITYHPTRRFDLDRITPTENDRWWRNQQVHGYVHDPSTAIFGGVGGQAGLFSNAWDLAAVMQMLVDGGCYAGTRLFSPSTVNYFTARQAGSHRGLGFDMQSSSPQPDKGMVAWSAHPTTYGHTGFTGTCAWADPVNDIVFVFLSNRVYPKADNKLINGLRIRQIIQETIYAALRLSHALPGAQIAGVDCYVE